MVCVPARACVHVCMIERQAGRQTDRQTKGSNREWLVLPLLSHPASGKPGRVQLGICREKGEDYLSKIPFPLCELFL